MVRFALLALPLVFALSACADRWTPPAGVFPILGWVNPPKSFESAERYQEMADAGFTIVHHCSATSGPLAKGAGMHFFMHLGVPDPAEEAGRKRIEEMVAKWKDDSHCVGYDLMDEPNAGRFPALAAVTRAVESLDPKAVCFINLFPNYANAEQLGAPTYAEHVEQYMTQVRPKVLCFDHYPLVGPTAVRGNYYENLEIIRAAALKHDTPFWAFALTCPHGPYRNPTEAEVRFQVFSDIVYGAQGIFYFTYWTPVDAHWGFHNAIIEVDGTRTEHYERVTRINAKLKAWGPTLLKLTSDEVRHTGNIPAGTRAYPADMATGGDFIVGEFTHADGSKWVMVMNRDFTSTRTLSLNLPGITALRELWETGELLGPITSPDSLFDLSVDAGDAALYRIGG